MNELRSYENAEDNEMEWLIDEAAAKARVDKFVKEQLGEDTSRTQIKFGLKKEPCWLTVQL